MTFTTIDVRNQQARRQAGAVSRYEGLPMIRTGRMRMFRTAWRCLGTSLIAASIELVPAPLQPARALQAQAPTRLVVSSAPSCTMCRLSASRTATLGTAEDSLIVRGAWQAVLRTQAGTYAAANLISAGSDHIRLYDRSGQFVRRIGQPGQGPGEFRSITHVAIGSGDSIYVFEPARLSVLSPAGSLVRTSPMTFITTQAVLLNDGELLVSAQRYTRDLAGLPVHRLSRDGNHLTSFGADPVVFDRERPSLSTRKIARANADRVWLARPDLYEIELWTLDGVRERILTRNAEWFPPRRVEWYTSAPTPYLLDMQAGEDGYLWVLTALAADDWRKHNIEIQAEVPFSAADQDKLYDSMVEVIDPVAGQLVTSLRLPFRAGGFVDNRRIWTLRETETGLFLLDIWQLNFHRNRRN